MASTTTTYFYDGLNLVAETTSGLISYFLNGPGIDEPIAMSISGAISYFSVDSLGSVATTNDPAGTINHNAVLDAWGNTRTETGTRQHPFTYTGREVGEAGLLFYRARFYQPSIGRFSQEDPFLNPSGTVVSDALLAVKGLGRPAARVGRPMSGVAPGNRLLIGPSDYSYTHSSPAQMRDPLGLKDDWGSHYDWGNGPPYTRPCPVGPPPEHCPFEECMSNCTSFFSPWQFYPPFFAFDAATKFKSPITIAYGGGTFVGCFMYCAPNSCFPSAKPWDLF